MEERRFIVNRTADGILIRIVDSRERDIIDPILLPFHEAIKLGKILIANAKAGMVQTDLLVRKLASLEHEIIKLSNKLNKILENLQETH